VVFTLLSLAGLMVNFW